MKPLRNLFRLLISIQVFSISLKISIATDTLASSQSLSDDGNTLISGDGSFELGFFSPGTSKNRYLGIWYTNIPDRTVVWVANRASPISGSSGMLMIDINSGNLLILSHNGTVPVWSSNSSRTTDDPILQLLNSGNLVLRDEKQDQSDSSLYLWQSFDYPSDTVLPGMKIGWDNRTGLIRRLTAWKDSTDPSPGQLSLGLENPYPERVVRKGSKKFTRSGPWNGIGYSGVPQLSANKVYVVSFVVNENEAYYVYHMKENSPVITRLVLNETDSELARYTWNEAERSWQTFRSFPIDQCDNYGYCGPYGICSINHTPVCQCLEGFQPKFPEKWESMDWSDGCVRTKPVNCSREAEFTIFKGLKLPDTTSSWLNQTMNLKECEAECSRNCSCTAYSNSDIRGKGSGCVIWTGDLMDIKLLAPTGQDLYIRMAFSESGIPSFTSFFLTYSSILTLFWLESQMLPHEITDHKHNIKVILLSIAVILPTLGTLVIIGYSIRRREKLRVNIENDKSTMKEDELELPVFKLATIVKATCNFSPENKLGEGGFGPVYKGIHNDGQEIAVKRLSQSSFQGQVEFKNEVILIAKLQHRNLVKLLGCCIEREEKMLIYEYMPNRSLDHFIFDHAQENSIYWTHRFRIICGIARGLLYLHQDSRLRIIHRDLKASNILLDDKMNPKISDFGTAKLFGGDQTEGSTKRVVGTHGYMAPEYVMDGLFSTKSDVFSFGVLVLEILSGSKNGASFHRDYRLNLTGYAWLLWKDARPLHLMDESLLGSYDFEQVVRCIHVGLLCVQEHPEDRPSMSSVVLMLASNNHHLPEPKQPAFFVDRNPVQGTDVSPSRKLSTIEVTVTQLEGR